MVKEIPLTEGRGTAYSVIDYEAAKSRASKAEQSGDSQSANTGLKLADFEAARKKSSRSFFEKLLNEAQLSLQALKQLEIAADARLGLDGPSFSPAREAIEQVLQTISRFAQDAGVRSADVHAAGGEDEVTASAVIDGLNTQRHAGIIQSRADALGQLRDVAEFFRRTEPHSPVAYLAEKAAAWGDMPLHTWLSTVIKDPGSLAHIQELLGLHSQ